MLKTGVIIFILQFNLYFTSILVNVILFNLLECIAAIANRNQQYLVFTFASFAITPRAMRFYNITISRCHVSHLD